MNAIGIDYGQARSVIALREGTSAEACTLLDDGKSRLIPHAVWGTSWGSRALEVGASPPWQAEAYQPGPWVKRAEAVAFWKALHNHIRGYLGGVPPGRRYGYEVAVCTEAEPPAQAEVTLAPIIREAGWDEVDWVPSTHALLCSWLLEAGQIEGPRKVAVVACGDTTTRVGAYLVNAWSRQPEIVEAYITGQALLAGYSVWERTIRQMVLERLAVPEQDLPAEWNLSLHREMPIFAIRLARMGRCEWQGLLRAQMFSEFSLARRDCNIWPTVATLRADLPAMVEEALAQVAGRTSSRVIVVGGVGALWPFCQEAVAVLGPLWPSRSPEWSLAYGAAVWPLLRSRFPVLDFPQAQTSDGTTGSREFLPPARTGPANLDQYQQLIRRIQADPEQDG